MRDALLDLVKQSQGFEALRVTGTATETVVKGCDPEKTLFLEATFKQPVAAFEGEFGLTNLTLLKGLLDFPNYLTSDATFTVKKKERQGVTMVEQFEFRNPVTGNDNDFRMMDPALVPDQATIPNIPWDVTITPQRAKVTEFTQLANLYAEVDKSFGVRTKNGDLQFFIGDEDSSRHRGSMVFEAGVQGEMKGNLTWVTHQFLNVMKMAGSNPTTLKFTSRGVLGVTVETAMGTYNYFMRANR